MELYEVVIPVYNPDKRLYEIIKRLLKQKAAPSKINLFLTVSEKYSELDLVKGLKAGNISDKRITVYTLDKEEFNHGGTRQSAAEECKTPFCLFMTQDAVPVDVNLTKNLISETAKEKTAVCYARQLPYKDAGLKEKYARNYNYPPKSEIKDKSLLEQGKIKAIFCSDVCAMYDMGIFRKLGGFERNVDFNEDMLYAYKALENDYLISYSAKALVMHSHNLTLKEQYLRNKEIAKSQKQHPEVFGRLSSENEGVSFVKNGIAYMMKNGGIFDVISFVTDCTVRFIGYRVGKHYRQV